MCNNPDRNCCFNVVGHQAMLTPEGTKVAVEGAKPTSGVDVLPYILFPLAGPEELEPDVGFDLVILTCN